MNLHNEIMNIPDNKATIACSGWTDDEIKVYKIGHRDARHAAAELSLQHAEDPEYELIQDDMLVAATAGKGAYEEILHYAAMYSQDGPVEIYEVTKRKVLSMGQT